MAGVAGQGSDGDILAARPLLLLLLLLVACKPGSAATAAGCWLACLQDPGDHDATSRGSMTAPSAAWSLLSLRTTPVMVFLLLLPLLMLVMLLCISAREVLSCVCPFLQLQPRCVKCSKYRRHSQYCQCRDARHRSKSCFTTIH
jgi:hypothetical protein